MDFIWGYGSRFFEGRIQVISIRIRNPVKRVEINQKCRLCGLARKIIKNSSELKAFPFRLMSCCSIGMIDCIYFQLGVYSLKKGVFNAFESEFAFFLLISFSYLFFQCTYIFHNIQPWYFLTHDFYPFIKGTIYMKTRNN